MSLRSKCPFFGRRRVGIVSAESERLDALPPSRGRTTTVRSLARSLPRGSLTGHRGHPPLRSASLSPRRRRVQDLSASLTDDDDFELMIRNTWHILGGEGKAANSANLRVLVSFKVKVLWRNAT